MPSEPSPIKAEAADTLSAQLLRQAIPWFNPEQDLAAMHKQRRIALVDCDQFYVSCERLFRPDLRHKPVIVLSSNDGCAIARAQEARDLGITMGMPWFQIKERFNQPQIGSNNPIIAFSANFTLYEGMSERVMISLASLGYETEIYSIDEAFVALPMNRPAEEQAQELVAHIYRWTGIPVTVGVGASKSQAKLATWLAKRRYQRKWHVLSVSQLNPHPNSHLSPHPGPHLNLDELSGIPVEAVWGIGRRHAARLQARKIFTVADFMRQDPKWVHKKMSIQGLRLFVELHGICCHPVQAQVKPQAQILHSRSFAHDERDLNKLWAWLAGFVVHASHKLRQQKQLAGSLSVFLLPNRFKQPSESAFLSTSGWSAYDGAHSLSSPLNPATDFTPQLLAQAHDLLKALYQRGGSYKKMGICLSQLSPRAETTLNWLQDPETQERQTQLMHSIDQLNQKYGLQTLKYACQLKAVPYALQQFRSPQYLTRWDALPELRRPQQGKTPLQ